VIFTTSIKYPITFDYVSGKTNLDDYVISINRCIALCLTSAKNELLGDPDFGSNLYEMLFEQYSDNLQVLIKQEIVDCITKFESRITVTDNNITIEKKNDGNKNSFDIHISYTVTRTNKQFDTTVTLEEDRDG
jgi:phage baseplate assembly protein W